MPAKKHPWNLIPHEAVLLQKKLAEKIIFEKKPLQVRTVAGVDVAIMKNAAIATVVVFNYPDLEKVDISFSS